MRVAFVHFYTFRLLRGIETLIISLANEMVDLGADVSILTAQRTQTPLVPPDPRVRVHEFPVPRYFAHSFISMPYLWTLLRQRYDYVITFFADFGEATAWQAARRLTRTQMVVYLCYPYSEVPHRYRSMARRGFFRTARGILADARYVAQDAAAFVGRPIEVVPVGSDPKRFRFDAEKRAATRQRYGYTDEHIVLLNVSALEPRKGVWRIIEALPDILRAVPEARYLILGRGDDEPRLRQMTRERGLEQVVTFAGTTTDLPAYYSAADLFVMLPDGEANSVASHEALSCQLPVVVSASGGFLEVMKPEFARLVPPEPPQAFVSAVVELARDPAKRRAMGAAGRQYVEAHLSWRASAAKLLDYLRAWKSL